MSKLTASHRAALRDEDFAFPKERKYPIYDKGHAQYAIKIASIHKGDGSMSVSKYNSLIKKINEKYGWKAKIIKT